MEDKDEMRKKKAGGVACGVGAGPGRAGTTGAGLGSHSATTTLSKDLSYTPLIKQRKDMDYQKSFTSWNDEWSNGQISFENLSTGRILEVSSLGE